MLSMRDPRVRPSASLVTILVERIYDLTAVALMFAVNLIWFKPPLTLEVSFDQVRIAGFGLLAPSFSASLFSHWFRKRFVARDRVFRTTLRALALCSAGDSGNLSSGFLNNWPRRFACSSTFVSWRKPSVGRRCLAWHSGGQSAGNASFSSRRWIFGNDLRAGSGRWWVHWCRHPAAPPAPFMLRLPPVCCFSA